MEEITKATETGLMLRKQSGSLACLLNSDPGNPNNQKAQLDFIRAQMEITVQSALSTPQMSKIRKEAPEDLTEALTRLLAFINNQLNIAPDKRLGTLQTAVLSKEIITRYWYLKFDEVVYVFREGITGRYGKLYGAFDAMTIHGWIDTYVKGERDHEVEALAQKQASKHKEAERNFTPDERDQAGYERYIETLKKLTGYTQAPGDETDKEKAYLEYRKRFLTGRIQPEQSEPQSEKAA